MAQVYGTTVFDQRCLFHKLRNVADKCREDLKGEAKKEERKQLLEQAVEIYQAESALQAYLRLIVWAITWREQARHPRWRPESGTLNRPSPSTPWKGSRGNGYGLPPC